MSTAPSHAKPVPPATGRRRPPRRLGVFLATLAPRTLRGRLALTFTGLVVVVLAALGIYLAVGARQLYVDRLADQLSAQTRLVAAAVAPTLAAGGGIDAVDPLVKRLGAQIDARITVIAPDGTVLGDSFADPRAMENHANRPEVATARTSAGGESQQQRHSATLDTDFLYVAAPISGAPGAVARVAMPLDEVNAAVRRIQRVVGAAAAIAAGLAAVVAVFVAARITAPLVALRRQARAVAAGRLDASVRPAATRELGDVGRAFNAMTADLSRLAAEQGRTRDRLEATLTNLNDGVVITDETGAVARLNGAAERIIGITSEEAAGRPFIVVSRDHDLAGLLQAALATGKPQAATVAYTHGRRVLEVSARPVPSGGERIGLVVLRDVTELRRLEGVRREFVANVSHELRTPLASIKSLAETLLAGARDDPAVADEFLGRIAGEVDHLTELVDELLDLARLEAGRIVLRPEAFDPADVLPRAVERLRPQAERAGLRLRVEIPPGLPAIRVDRTRLEQVMLNLIHNAIKFTPEGGEIVAAATVAGGMLRVSVRDTGVGIAVAELPRVFERFYKSDKARRSVGTGLGLAIAKHIVQAHDGEIWVESEPGRGTTFSFTVPLAAPPDEAAADRDSSRLTTAAGG